jgi:hypothetical protein
VQAGVGVLRLAIERTDRPDPHGSRAVLTAKRARRKRDPDLFRAPNRESRHRRLPQEHA